jgi:hypothetical protein
LVQEPVQQQGSPTASLSYTSFEDDSLQQNLVTLQEVCLDSEVCRLEQLLQDLSSTCSSLADKVGADAHALGMLSGHISLQRLRALLLCQACWLSGMLAM